MSLLKICIVILTLIIGTLVPAADKISVFVGILPQKYIAEQIGGDKVSVQVMVPPGKDPHVYEPRPRQVSDLSTSKIYFSIDMPFEKQVIEKIRSMGMKTRIADMAKGIKRVALEKHLAGHAEAHHHHGDLEGDDHDDDPNAPDPHIWLSIPLLKTMAENTAGELSAVDPVNAAFYKNNLDLFLKKADETFKRVKAGLAAYNGETFFVYHPAFGYFADDYGLKQYAVETEGKSPAPKELERLIKEAKAKNVKIIFVQPQFDRKSAEAVARAISGTVVPMDDLSENVLENLNSIALAVEQAMKDKNKK